ncbi:hypothetical protein AAFF_G00109970 [Aldrovandia affinis]|uniref:Reverse transcriptase domain-containing protein n=1 Tax=Aldrovandia affinis TaxID=143900 RepID=A0AAD7RTZ9_9TELE|nr:hypothetical protein AAFF_G00109970 [Aldrovandia affinis]
MWGDIFLLPLSHSDAGFTWRNSRGAASHLDYIFVGRGKSVVEWWEAAKRHFATFCQRYVVAACQRDGAGVAKWMASLAYLHGCFNHGEPVDWAVYEGAKERGGLLEARGKALAFQARLCELEEVREALLSLGTTGSLRSSTPLSGTSWGLTSWRSTGPFWRGGSCRSPCERASSYSRTRGVTGQSWETGRKLALLTTDCKVLAKVVTACLRRVMGGLVSQDQTCGVPGRSCSWNLILLRDMLDWVSIDLEKAFDRVQHGFLFAVLGQMGSGPGSLAGFACWRVQLRPGEWVPEQGGGACWGGAAGMPALPAALRTVHGAFCWAGVPGPGR